MSSNNSSSPHSEDVEVRVDGDVSGQVAIGEHIIQIGDVHGSEVTIGQRITNFISGSVEQQRAQRNRRTMLQLVKNTWVVGVLEQSLHSAAMIALGLEERTEAVEHPWEMILRASGEPNQPLPPSTRIADIFDSMDRALLILGAPGAGKTTMLLELARHAIARAEQDPTQPIPVVFNLSSWAGKRQPIAEWLVEELNVQYHVRKTTARDWVEHDELLLLLDGLDEVREEHREACVQAINAFRRECGVPMAICSRVADYEALSGRLDLRGAVLLQPLKPQQVDAYLDRAEEELAAVREMWRSDPVFQELAQVPLMLSVAALAYRGLPFEEIQQGGTVEGRRRHLFDTYVERMFARPRKSGPPCTREQAVHWLAWLAWQMTAHAQTVFLIEGLQPDWLPEGARRWARLAARLVFGLIFGLPLGLVLGLVGGLSFGLDFGLIAGLVGELSFGLVFGLGGRLDSVKTVERLTWSGREGIKKIIGNWHLTLVGGLGAGLVFGVIFGLTAGPVAGLIAGLVFGLVAGLFFGLINGVGYIEVELRTIPNQGIRLSVRNMLVAGLVFGLSFGLVLGLVLGLGGGLSFGLPVGLVGGLGAGLVLGLGGGLFTGLFYYGSAPVTLHLVLRTFLHRYNSLPWRVVPFLDYAAERILLRKVGGGYIFVHRLLQEYFAALYENEEDTL
jgi:hypothetical protein